MSVDRFDSQIVSDSLDPDTTYDMLVFIGRFMPVHYGHQRVIDIALKRSQKVLILLGSSNIGRTIRNPFLPEERHGMIASEYQDALDKGRLVVRPIDDHMYADDQWIEQVQEEIRKETMWGYKNIGLIGCEKDHTSYYLSLFPTLKNVGVEFKVPLNSTDIRELIFKNDKLQVDDLSYACAPGVIKTIQEFQKSKDFKNLLEEWNWIKRYKEKRQTSNYPVIDVTVDACVVQSGHVLVVTRKAMPGKDKFALPGGFLNPDEPILNAQLRELREETNIDLSDTVLRANLLKQKVFSNPHRSDRGRIITHACYIRLQDKPTLPKVKGGDDASHAFWLPLNNVEPARFFEDHSFLIKNLISGV